jgi:ketosteroid isomerase-like protein
LSASTEATIEAFNEAFGRHDVDAVMALMTDDCIFENTLPAPDGERHAGKRDVRKFWEKFFRDTPNASFETEELVVAGDRAVARWRFDWGGGHVRGIDLFKVRDGKVAEKLSYVKG